MTEAIRLAKRLAASLPCSRGEAERYIAGGWVLVDGQVVEEPGLRVLPQQRVELLPQASAAALEPVTLLLHKPAGTRAEVAALLPLLTQEAHAADDHTRIRFLKRHLDGLTLVAPLEAAASGLQVLTQDWRVARKLVDDLASTEQEYIVEVGGAAGAAADSLARLNQGLRWNGKLLAPAKVSWQSETRLRFALKAPQAGQIAATCEQAGLTVLSVKRIRIGRVPMAGLPLGQWRYLAGYQRF
ncbi:MAG TPA: RNA pseudouridine synthase [Burkholderiaceae bacterium]|nr:RNA pseudouridine synthase [Burkholderiaceae bacterium]